jgi:hypothetical protein
MKEMGLEPVAHLGGGINAWKAAGGQVEGIGSGLYAAKLSEVHKLLLGVTKPDQLTEEEGWSVKQVVGHLLDSCSNNHQRLCRSIPGGELAFPAYDQNAFMQTANYAAYDYQKLVQLWFGYNQLLLHMYHSMPEDIATQTRIKVGERPAVTIHELIRDYFGHMDVHVAQIQRALA